MAGCLPALVQIPIFISLYRALTNLVAENKLSDPFLWIPSLEGPVYSRTAAHTGDWISSITSGNPLLGWHDTLAFLSLPLILFISQSISQKLLQPARDPSKPMTDQEQMSQGLINNLPLIVAFFSLNVPAGLSVYWIVNNILTTLVTLAIKNSLKDEAFPPEVTQMMSLIEGVPTAGTRVGVGVGERAKQSKQSQLSTGGEKQGDAQLENVKNENRSQPRGFAKNAKIQDATDKDTNRSSSGFLKKKYNDDSVDAFGDLTELEQEAQLISKISEPTTTVNNSKISIESDVDAAKQRKKT